jgi:glucose-1-phosphate adenylyltransferase
MDYEPMITFHLDQHADLTMGTIRVPMQEASRFGILDVDKKYRVRAFVEKPEVPPSNLINMGVYLFNRDLLDRILWEDHLREDSAHDFGKDILPRLVKSKARVFAFPYTGYWMDVGTMHSYWQAHMDLLSPNPPLKLYDRRWVIHTRTEERPPARIPDKACIYASMVADGCYIQQDARVESSVLSPGVIVRPGAVVRESIILTDCVIEEGAVVERAIVDKYVTIGHNARVGGGIANPDIQLAIIGKHSQVLPGMVVEPGATIATDVIPSDYEGAVIKSGETITTKRKPYEI